MGIEIILSGFFFWFIIITNFASERFGYITFNDTDSKTKLQWISGNLGKFKTGFLIILIEHLSIIALAVLLFISFRSYNIQLAVIWVIARSFEGLIQIYYKREYWGLLNLAVKFGNSNISEKQKFIDSGQTILNRKQSRFVFAQILFAIGTLSYSILFASSGVVPVWIGWSGIAASVLYGMGNGIVLIKPEIKVVWNIGGLLVLLFEIILGGWLLFFSH